MNLFFAPQIFLQQFCVLSEEESKHLQVLRKNVGDCIDLFCGDGIHYEAEIISFQKREITVLPKKIIHQWDAPNPTLQIAIAPTKQLDRLEWFVEKATEIGIQKITPLICDRSERKILKTDRLQKIALSATKQSKQFFIPQIEEAQTFKNFLQNDFSNTTKLVAFCQEKTKSFTEAIQPKKNTTLLIGPEGDFTENEIQLLKKQEFESVTFGKNILRVETAGVFATAIFNQ